MDMKTLEYMGTRVDEARKLRKRISKLDDLLEKLDHYTVAYLKFEYKHTHNNGGSIREHEVINDSVLGNVDYLALASALVATTVGHLQQNRNCLMDELAQL